MLITRFVGIDWHPQCCVQDSHGVGFWLNLKKTALPFFDFKVSHNTGLNSYRFLLLFWFRIAWSAPITLKIHVLRMNAWYSREWTNWSHVLRNASVYDPVVRTSIILSPKLTNLSILRIGCQISEQSLAKLLSVPDPKNDWISNLFGIKLSNHQSVLNIPAFHLWPLQYNNESQKSKPIRPAQRTALKSKTQKVEHTRKDYTRSKVTITIYERQCRLLSVTFSIQQSW